MDQLRVQKVQRQKNEDQAGKNQDIICKGGVGAQDVDADNLQQSFPLDFVAAVMPVFNHPLQIDAVVDNEFVYG